MEKLFNKWYFGLVIIPVIINYLTDSVGLPELFENWAYTIVGIFIILTGILAIELIHLNKKYKKLKNLPKQTDKKIVKELLSILDIDDFQYKIKEQDSWYGYEQDAIRKCGIFAEKAGLISYKTTDAKLNFIIAKLKESVDDFISYTGKQLYPSGHFYAPAKDTEINKRNAEIARPIMNKKADLAFEKLELLVRYVKENNYLEE